MIKNILEAVNTFSLLENVRTVTVALSGGADSMALLYALVSLKDKLNITVKAAHFNHQIRGNEALRDEEFVKEQCRMLGVELFCESADVPRFAKEKGVSLELAARELRYAFFEKINEGVIATAHTASDNIETVLFNLTRGTALQGLCGIPPKRDIFIRPLILCTREQIEEYCKENNISYMTDSTNLCDDYTRNKIRHHIIPRLKDINPSVEKSVLRTSSALREDGEILNKLALDYVKQNTDNGLLKLDGFKKLSPAITKRVIIFFTESVKKEITLENIHIEEIYKAIGKNCKISLPKNHSAVIWNNSLKITPNSKNLQNCTEYTVNLTGNDVSFIKTNEKINNLLLNNSLDCDKIVGQSVLRTRMSGDSIRLKDRGCTKTLNRLFSEEKIPIEERDKLPVLADEKGVIWVYGLGVANRCAVTASTKKILIVETKKRGE